jgi:FtsH-binding integral membrane protein
MDIDSNRNARPKKVQNAVTILYITLGIGIVRAVIEASANAEMAGVGFFMFITLVLVALIMLLIAMIARGRNWARITCLVLFLLGLLPSILALIRSFTLSPISGVLEMVQVVLTIVALVLLFQQDSSAWFRTKAAVT